MQWKKKNLRSLTSLFLRSSAQVWLAVWEGKLSSSLPSSPSCEGTSCRGFPQSLKQERFSSCHIIPNWTPASISTRDLKWKASVLKKKKKRESKSRESGKMPPCDVTKGCQSPPGLMTTPSEHRVKCVVPGGGGYLLKCCSVKMSAKAWHNMGASVMNIKLHPLSILTTAGGFRQVRTDVDDKLIQLLFLMDHW